MPLSCRAVQPVQRPLRTSAILSVARRAQEQQNCGVGDGIREHVRCIEHGDVAGLRCGEIDTVQGTSNNVVS